jgi:hypothetical protein
MRFLAVSRYFLLARNISSVHCLRIFPACFIPLMSKNKFHTNLNNKEIVGLGILIFMFLELILPFSIVLFFLYCFETYIQETAT